jgi:hypothetical protein
VPGHGGPAPAHGARFCRVGHTGHEGIVAHRANERVWQA